MEAKIDIDKFTELIKQALIASAIPEQKPEPIKKKRGRPKKEKVVIPPVEVLMDVEDIDNEPEDDTPPPPPKTVVAPKTARGTPYIAPAKAQDFEARGAQMKTVEWTPPSEPNKFDSMREFNAHKNLSYDLKTGEKLKYPEPAEGRPPVQKQKYKCDRCNSEFWAYPSEVPQARPMGVGTGEGVGRAESFTPFVYCNACADIGGRRR